MYISKLFTTVSINRKLGSQLLISSFFAIVLFVLMATVAFAQSYSQYDSTQSANFTKICSDISSMGYKNPVIVGYGDSTAKDIYVLLANKKNKGVLIAVTVVNGKTSKRPIVLAQDKTPEDIGEIDLKISRFFDVADVYDIEVNYHPYTLNSTLKYNKHHLVRFKGSNSEKICEFLGTSISTYSNGIKSISYSRQVSIEKVPAEDAFKFKVIAIEKNSEQNYSKEPILISQNEDVKEYKLSATGVSKGR